MVKKLIVAVANSCLCYINRIMNNSNIKKEVFKEKIEVFKEKIEIGFQ